MFSNKHIILELLSVRHERLSNFFFRNMSTCKPDSKLTYLLEKEIPNITRGTRQSAPAQYQKLNVVREAS